MDESEPNIEDNLNQLQQHREALESEYRLAQEDPMQARQIGRDKLDLLFVDAVETLGDLMRSASSDSVRLRASQFIVGSVLDADKVADADESMRKLLERLKV